MSFARSLAAGGAGERAVGGLLQGAGLPARPNDGPRGGLSRWDLWSTVNGRPFTVEIKHDLMAARTGNLAVEVWNPRADRPSGLSATTADIWAFVIGGEVWACGVPALRAVVAGPLPPGARFVARAGDGNAALKVYPRAWLLAAAGFTRLGTVDNPVIEAIMTLLTPPVDP